MSMVGAMSVVGAMSAVVDPVLGAADLVAFGVVTVPLLWMALIGAAARRCRPVGERTGSLPLGSHRDRPGVADQVARLGRAVRSMAGRPSSPPQDRRVGVLCLGGVLALLGVVALGSIGVLLAIAPPLWFAASTRRQRRELGAASLDGALEATQLLALALQAGGTVRTALADVAPWLRGPAADLVSGLLERCGRGWLLADELDRAALGAPPPLRQLLVVLRSAERDGAPVVANLERLAAELRIDQRRALEAAARRVPVRLLFPLVAGVLPAVVLLAVVPLLIAALGNVRAGP